MKQARIVLAIAIALAMAVPALAINVEWHGDFHNRASYSTQADLSRRVVHDTRTFIGVGGFNNYDQIVDGVDTRKSAKDSDFFAEIKYRININVFDDENRFRGVIGFEFGGSKFGDKDLKFGGDSRDFLQVMWAYSELELPFDPASRLRFGLQPVGYNYLLWSDNAAGAKWIRKQGNWAYSLGWFRDNFTDNNTLGGKNRARYSNAYVGDLTYTFDNGNSLNGFVIYLDKNNEDRALRDGGFYAGDLNEDLIGKPQDQQIWLGLSGRGKWRDFSGLFTGMYLTGELKTGGALNQKYDRQGYLFHGEVDYRIDRTTFTLGGLYTSGDKNPDDKKLKNFDVIDVGTQIFGSVVIFDSICDDNSFTQAPYLFDKGYAMIYAGVRHDLTDRTWLTGRYLWHNTAEDLVTAQGKASDIGHEFVLGVGHRLMKGLTAELKAGYLVGGDAWDAMARNGKGDDVFRTDANLRFRF